MNESKTDRFRRVAEARVNKIIKMIRLLGNCSGTGVYEYTDEQVAYIFSALQSELDKAKRRFRKPSLGKHRFSLTDTNEFDNDRPLEPTIALALPDGSYLRAVVYEDDHFPAINIYWDRDGGKSSELLCFAEYNSERDEGAQVCIGAYVSDEDETQYYAPYMAERNITKRWAAGDDTRLPICFSERNIIMHFKTLVTVNMPTVEEDPHENAAVEQSIELLQARKDDLAKEIMAELTLCSLMGRTTNFARQLVGAVEEVMTPYSTEPPEEYKEFADMTEELKADYAKSVDCLKLPNGKIVECGSYPYFSKYSIVDGKVSQNKVGHLHHTRRTKQSRKIQYLPNCPRQKAYKTFEKYAEDYRGYEYNEEEKGYGFYCNPNAMWDWYQIGGRWPVTFLVKADCTEYSFGERSWGNYSKKYPAPEGYMWVSAARKKDICWDIMRSWYIAQDTERYNKLKEAFQSGNLPNGYYGEIRANGIFCYGECAYANGETLDEYLARVGIPKSWKYPIGVSDIVDADDWLSKNDISIGKESGSWHEQIDTYIDDLDGEDVLVSVDYHI